MSEYQVPPTYYHGRRWDAPVMDEAVEMDDDAAKLLLAGESKCDHCQEPLLYTENVLMLPYLVGHTECQIRAAIGNVVHLEGRCICSRSAAE